MKEIFISYKRVDQDKVFKIKDKIESVIGEKCWIDIEGIRSDAQFKNVIIDAIKNAEIVLFMYSKAHSKITDFENDWTVRELNFAKRKKKRIVFVNIDGSPLTDEFAFDFGSKQHIDARSEENLTRLIEDLRNWLHVLVAGDSTAVKAGVSDNIYIEEDRAFSKVEGFDLGYDMTIFVIHKLRGVSTDNEEKEVILKMVEAGLNPDMLLKDISTDDMVERLSDCAVALGKKNNKDIENSVCLGALFVLAALARKSNVNEEFAHSYDKGLIIASQNLGIPAWVIERMEKANGKELEDMWREIRSWIN